MTDDDAVKRQHNAERMLNATTGSADNDSAAVGAGDLVIDLFYM